ncbi:MAG: hypothetical protein CSA62_06520 [Planctomycetota bacterium]|nr:MAG: hypothetical protein CSA62_06520 [Planctomycetota bacterium]
MLRRSVLPLLALLATASILSAQEKTAEEFEARWKKIEQDFVPGLARVAEWADQKSLRHQAHKLYALLLQFQPQHPRARKVLKYHKTKSGSWERRGRYRLPPPRNSKHKDEFELRWLTVQQSLVTRALRLIEELRQAEDEQEEDLMEAERYRMIRQTLVAVAPEDPKVRKLNGEARKDGKWLLEESLLTMTRRAELMDLARKELEAVKAPQAFEISAATKKLGNWNGAARSKHLRVVTTTGQEEAALIARYAEAAGIFGRSQMRMAARFPAGFQIHVMQSKAEWQSFLDKIPKLPPQRRAQLSKLGGFSFGHGQLAIWSKERKARIDSVCRQVIQLFANQYFGVNDQHAWIMEGMGLYISGLVCGTRLTWFVAPTRYAKRESTRWERAMKKDFDWLPPAKELIESKECPSLRNCFRRSLSSMNDKEVLLAFAFSAYLIEGRPEDVPWVIRGCVEAEKERERPQEIFDAMGLDEGEVNARFRRWLKETL